MVVFVLRLHGGRGCCIYVLEKAGSPLAADINYSQHRGKVDFWHDTIVRCLIYFVALLLVVGLL